MIRKKKNFLQNIIFRVLNIRNKKKLLEKNKFHMSENH